MAITFHVRLYASGLNNQPRKMNNIFTSARVSVPVLRAFCYWFIKQIISNKKPKLLETAREFPVSSQLLLTFRQSDKLEILAAMTGSMLTSLCLEINKVFNFCGILFTMMQLMLASYSHIWWEMEDTVRFCSLL